MSIIKNEISKELYDQVKDVKGCDNRKKFFNIPIDWERGYGYYGCDVVARDDKYYVIHTIGSTCD